MAKKPQPSYWYQYLIASKRKPRLNHQVPLRMRVQSLESGGDILGSFNNGSDSMGNLMILSLKNTMEFEDLGSFSGGGVLQVIF